MDSAEENTAIVPATLSPFVTVPATTLPDGHVEPSFQVGRYLCSNDAHGAAVIDAALAPWVNINYFDARAACSAAGFSLITERQALALALDIAGQAANWVGNVVGEGSLRRGLHKYSVGSVQPGAVVPAEGGEQRWFLLSNGERICDPVGNASTWVFDNVQGDAQGLVNRAFGVDSLTITTAPYPSRECGVGAYPRVGHNWSSYALIRGGSFRGEEDIGLFYLHCDWPGDGDSRGLDDVGFRCTK